jgi:hypothetical protein
MGTLYSGQSLNPDQSVQSPNRLHTLVMQEDGNVVLHDRSNQPLWATNISPSIAPRKLVMHDGNLVLYSTDGKASWVGGTWNNPGAFLKSRMMVTS